ncbi:MAG: hypothetical protein V3V05_07725 [Pontiella sp.]
MDFKNSSWWVLSLAMMAGMLASAYTPDAALTDRDGILELRLGATDRLKYKVGQTT